MGEMPPWWGGRDRVRQNRRSKAQETKRAKEVGGRPQGGSGSSWRARGDVKTDATLEELKYTDRASFPLKVSEWKLHRDRALKQGREPVMVVEFPQHNLRLVIREE